MAETRERDLRDYGMDYTKRLSVRVSEQQLRWVDAGADLAGVNRGTFIRRMIDRLPTLLAEQGWSE